MKIVSKFISNYHSDLINSIGRRLPNRKIVVFESDDWGMIRTRSKHSFLELKRKGYPVDSCVYNRFDSIERNQDLTGLFEVLSKHKGANGKPAKFTLNNIVANPDFDKIIDTDYKKYSYQLFEETLKEYSNSESVIEIQKQGLSEGLIQIQFHGREHVNINRWLTALQSGSQRFLDAFDQRQFTVAGQKQSSGRKDMLDAFGRAYSQECESEESIIQTGLKLFENIWGFKSESFIAPCYTWSTEIEPILKKGGVKFLQGTLVQRIPVVGLDLKVKKKYHWQGRKNKTGLQSIVRNVIFEPSNEPLNYNVVDKALAQVDTAFFWQKPAVICSHRVNYVGRIDEDNRTRNLRYLDELLTKITRKYQDVTFLSSDELGGLYN